MKITSRDYAPKGPFVWISPTLESRKNLEALESLPPPLAFPHLGGSLETSLEWTLKKKTVPIPISNRLPLNQESRKGSFQKGFSQKCTPLLAVAL